MSDGRKQNLASEAFQAALLEDSPEDLYDNAPCGYLSCSPDGTIVKVNQTFLTWTGYRREELVGRKLFQELLSVGGQIYYETHYGPLLQMQGEAREIAVDIVAADGLRLPALVNSVVTRDEAGTPAWIRTAVFDATDRRAYERELLEARRQAEASEARARVLAQTLQQSLLPPALPQIPGLDIAAVYRPARQGDEVGGDFYDVFETGKGDWAIVVGDVRGKGIEAAVVTGLARYTLRATAIRHPRPAQVLETLNNVLLRHGDDASCTAVYCRVRFQPVVPTASAWPAVGIPSPCGCGLPVRRSRSAGRAPSSAFSVRSTSPRSRPRCCPESRSSTSPTVSPRGATSTASSGKAGSSTPYMRSETRTPTRWREVSSTGSSTFRTASPGTTSPSSSPGGRRTRSEALTGRGRQVSCRR